MLTSSPPSEASSRRLSALDRLITHADNALRTVLGVTTSSREYPAQSHAETVLSDADRREISGLMRVNYAGEVAAQALYHGQALTARDPQTRALMQQAALEEGDHLNWCDRRIAELGGRRSVLNPFWYAGSFAIGALAGLAGDRTSFGFLAETERQVIEHLNSHLGRLPHGDARTKTILEQMSDDEAAHRDMALHAGGRELPRPIAALMKAAASVMTRTAAWI